MSLGPAALVLVLLAGLTMAAEPWTDLDLVDGGRTLPLRAWLPEHPAGPLPVVVFSHGLGGSRTGYGGLARAWAAAGYAVLLPSHPGSDTASLAGPGWRQRMAAATGDPALLRARPRDLGLVIDRLDEIAGRLPGRPRLDPRRVGVAGHSFGAWTALVATGLRAPAAGADAADPRPLACLALSPPGPSREDPAAGADVRRPVLVMTGTEDRQPAFLLRPGQDGDHRWRIRTFDLLAPGDKLLAVLTGARHGAFSDGDGARLLGEPPAEPWMAPAITAATTAWWDAWLRNDPTARTRLADGSAAGTGPDRIAWRWR